MLLLYAFTFETRWTWEEVVQVPWRRIQNTCTIHVIISMNLTPFHFILQTPKTGQWCLCKCLSKMRDPQAKTHPNWRWFRCFKITYQAGWIFCKRSMKIYPSSLWMSRIWDPILQKHRALIQNRMGVCMPKTCAENGGKYVCRSCISLYFCKFFIRQ